MDDFNAKSVSFKDKNAIRELYRNVYLQQWKNKTVQKVMSKRANLFGLSADEIRQGFGTHPDDARQGSMNLFIAEQARYVFFEYQRQLREDVFAQYYEDVISSHEGYRYVRHDVGYMILDTVTSRTFLKGQGIESGHGVLGRGQWEDINRWMRGELSAVNLLMVSVDATFFFDAPEEANELIKTLARWKRHDPSKNIVVISKVNSGGGHYVIFDNDQSPLLEWVLTSAQSGSLPSEYSEQLQLGSYVAQQQSKARRANIAIVDRLRENVSVRHVE